MELSRRPDDKVKVMFRNGDYLLADAVVRVVGADWITAIEYVPTDSDDDAEREENYVLHADDVRCINDGSVRPAHDHADVNARIHTPERVSDHRIASLCEDLPKGQHRLHPDDDPSAFPESEREWPQENHESPRPARGSR